MEVKKPRLVASLLIILLIISVVSLGFLSENGITGMVTGETLKEKIQEEVRKACEVYDVNYELVISQLEAENITLQEQVEMELYQQQQRQL